MAWEDGVRGWRSVDVLTGRSRATGFAPAAGSVGPVIAEIIELIHAASPKTTVS
jgi:hypothetical protein